MAEFGLSGYPLVFLRLFKTIGFLLLRFVFTSLQSIVWKWNGTATQIKESRQPENYDRCAHVVDVVLLNRFDDVQAWSMRNYIVTHNRFESPRYIFDNDHVSLITVDGENAIFGVAAKPGMHLWRMEYNAFMRLAQFIFVRQLIVVPLNHFNRMAEELGDPEGQLIFLFNTARCGSTLLTQMMQTTDRCVAISEPESFNVLALRYRKDGDSEKLRQLIRDTVRWTCRPHHNFKPLAYMVKITSPSIVALPVFKEIYPDSKYVFMYRDAIKVAQSIYRLSRESPLMVIMCTLGKLSATFSEKCTDAMGFPGKDFRVKYWDDLAMGIFALIVATKSYLELRRKGFEICAVRYEDLIGDKHYSAKATLKYCGLPKLLEEGFLRGMELDSQRNSIFSSEILSRHKDPPATEESKRLANEVLKKHGLPTVGEGKWLLEGTITFREC